MTVFEFGHFPPLHFVSVKEIEYCRSSGVQAFGAREARGEDERGGGEEEVEERDR